MKPTGRRIRKDRLGTLCYYTGLGDCKLQIYSDGRWLYIYSYGPYHDFIIHFNPASPDMVKIFAEILDEFFMNNEVEDLKNILEAHGMCFGSYYGSSTIRMGTKGLIDTILEGGVG